MTKRELLKGLRRQWSDAMGGPGEAQARQDYLNAGGKLPAGSEWGDTFDPADPQGPPPDPDAKVVVDPNPRFPVFGRIS